MKVAFSQAETVGAEGVHNRPEGVPLRQSLNTGSSASRNLLCAAARHAEQAAANLATLCESSPSVTQQSRSIGRESNTASGSSASALATTPCIFSRRALQARRDRGAVTKFAVVWGEYTANRRETQNPWKAGGVVESQPNQRLTYCVLCVLPLLREYVMHSRTRSRCTSARATAPTCCLRA